MEMKRAMTGDQPSSNIHSVGYDQATKTLAVCFLGKDKKSAGDVYHYHDAEPHHITEMTKPDVSTGSYLHQHFIKPKRKCTKQ